MTIDWTKPIETVDGQSARVLATDLDSSFPIVIAVTTASRDNETVLLLHSDGSYAKGKPPTVRNVPTAPIVRYINVYADNLTGGTYDSRADADDNAGPNRTACVRFEFREGQYDG